MAERCAPSLRICEAGISPFRAIRSAVTRSKTLFSWSSLRGSPADRPALSPMKMRLNRLAASTSANSGRLLPFTT